MIDLHTHSTASDGTDSPAQLVRAAAVAGLSTIALSDHDTTRGWQEAERAVNDLPPGFTLVPAAEFSCVLHDRAGRRIGLHLLGYLFDPSHDALKSERARLRDSRLGRGEAIVGNLVGAGYPISWQRVVELAQGGSVGRPHIAQALIEQDVVSSVSEAFTDLLSNRSAYYVAKNDMPVKRAITLITQAGGVPVIAHPWARRRGAVLSEESLGELVRAGLAGFEVNHPDHEPLDRQRLRVLAAELGAFGTGSSDYHGTNKITRLGAETTDPAVLERILACGKGREPLRSPRRRSS